MGVMLLASILLLNSCNEDLDRAKAAAIKLEGYNSTGEPLFMTIDTTTYIPNQSDVATWKNNAQLSNSILHPYFSTDKAVLKLTGAKSGKVYMEQPLDKNRLRQEYFFTWVNGKNTFNPPAPDANTNKIGIFIADPLMKGAVDVAIYVQSYIQEEERIIMGKPVYIKNVKPWEWVYIDYLLPKVKGQLNYAYFEFFKAGTNEWIYETDEYMSKKDVRLFKDNPDSFIYFPLADDKGKVFSYLFAADINNEDGQEHVGQTSLLYPYW